MKSLITLLTFCLINQSGIAQNIGIGTATPQGKLQVNHNSSSNVGLLLLDSSNSSSGSVEFRNVNNTKRILMQGYTESNFSNGQYMDIVSDSVFIATFRGNGRTGINNPSPNYPLDVNGDINTNGALRVNGSPGSGGQVLQSNGDGSMGWGNINQYNNFATLKSTAGSTWTVPAGVTKIMVEVWGAGGGGNVFAGGGGGGYIKAQFTVTAGDLVSYTTGVGGGGTVSSTAVNGSLSTCIVGAAAVTATGGMGALYLSATNGQGGNGGGYSIPGAFNNFIGLRGGSGKSQERTYYQVNATTFYESGKAGHGGDAGNSNTGGAGQTYLYNNTGATMVFRNGNPSGGLTPGGGGASGVQYGASNLGGGDGADGIIIVYY